MDESPTAVDSSRDVQKGVTPERWQLEQWNWIARARLAAARSLDLVPLNGLSPVETADPDTDTALAG
jgi:hypothetical protein